MRFLQFIRDGKVCLAAETAAGTVDIAREVALKGVTAPENMLALIEAGNEGMDTVKRLSEGASEFIEVKKFAPAVTGMEKILCVGLNYRAHAQEFNKPIPKAPIIFSKFGNTLRASGDEIFLPRNYKKYDYEAELVIIIGKAARDIEPEQAAEYIFGYTAGNDLSNREAQLISGQWLLGKSHDGFAPLGPYVVTSDSIDSGKLTVQSRVNGELRQNSCTDDLIFPCEEIVSYISKHMTLKPGDIIFSGTPSGVMQGYPPEKKAWLKPGDVVEIILGGIGTLRNTMI